MARFKLRVKAELSLVAGVDGVALTDAERVETRWPAMGHEIVPGETIPAETGVTGAAVSFTKGCYTGQELVERMDARQAAPPRRLVRITATASASIQAQHLIDRCQASDWRSCGMARRITNTSSCSKG